MTVTDYLLDITLVTPRGSKNVIESALKQNPHLTSFPMPSASVLAPSDLTHTMGTAELLRLPEVQACIKGDFMVLPCDLVCELAGEEIVGGWLETQSTLAGASDGDAFEHPISSKLGVNGEKSGRRGGMGVWYPMAPGSANHENPKEDAADFVVTARLEQAQAPLVKRPSPSPSDHPPEGVVKEESLCKVVYAAPMDSVRDQMETKGVLHLRQSLLKRHGRVKMLTGYRDAHIYIFPYWVKDMAAKNDKFESIGEDLVGWWAKAGWQDGLADKLQMRDTAHRRAKNLGFQRTDKLVVDHIDEHIDLVGMSTTQSRLIYDVKPDGSLALPGRQRPLPRADSMEQDKQSQEGEEEHLGGGSGGGDVERHDPDFLSSSLSSSSSPSPDKSLRVPQMLGYIHHPSGPMIRRVDNASLLLSITLRLAKLDPASASDAAHPFTHSNKIAFPDGVAQRTTISKADCLVGENTTVEEKCVLREAVVGANCRIASGARLTRCLVMDGVVVGERCILTGCVIGRRSKIGEQSELKDCEVQDGNVVPNQTEARGEKFMLFEGLDDDDEDGSAMDEGEAEIDMIG